MDISQVKEIKISFREDSNCSVYINGIEQKITYDEFKDAYDVHVKK